MTAGRLVYGLLPWAAALVACGPGLRYAQTPSVPMADTDVSSPPHKDRTVPEAVSEIVEATESSPIEPLTEDPQGAALLEDASAAEARGALIDSRRILLRLARTSVGTVQGQEAAFRLAEEAVDRQDWKGAAGWSSRARVAEGDLEGLRRQAYTLALAYEGQGNYEAAAGAWRQVSESVGDEVSVEVIGGHARTLLLAQRVHEALEILEEHPVEQELAEELLSGALPGEPLEALIFDEGPLSPWDTWLMLQRARQRCNQAMLVACREDAARAALSTDQEVAQAAHGLLERVRLWNQVQPRRMGLLLPLSTASGRRAREAVELAFTDHPEVELTVVDSGGRPESAREALRELVLTHGVVGVLGPLGPRETQAAAMEATRWGVPLLSLSRTPDPVATSHGAWRIRLSPQEQAAALARYCVLEQGVRRVALVYPSGTYGQHFMGAFWDEFVKHGGEVRAAESYEPKMTTADRETLVRELMGGEAVGEQDFEALLLVGRGRAGKRRSEDLRLFKDLLSHVRSQGLRIRVSPRGRGRPSPIQILGDGTWNDRRSIDMGEYLTDNALFVDGYLDDGAERDRQRFRSRVYARTSRRPDAFIAVAYDAANLMASRIMSVEQTEHDARIELSGSLARTRGFTGVTGPISLLHGAVGRAALMLTIDGEDIRARRSEAEESDLRRGRSQGLGN